MKLAVLADEFLGAVQGVDQPEHVLAGKIRDLTGAHPLLGDDRIARAQLFQTGQDHRLALLVGKGDWRAVGFGVGGRRAGIVLHDDVARLVGQLHHFCQQRRRISHDVASFLLGEAALGQHLCEQAGIHIAARKHHQCGPARQFDLVVKCCGESDRAARFYHQFEIAKGQHHGVHDFTVIDHQAARQKLFC